MKLLAGSNFEEAIEQYWNYVKCKFGLTLERREEYLGPVRISTAQLDYDSNGAYLHRFDPEGKIIFLRLDDECKAVGIDPGERVTVYWDELGTKLYDFSPDNLVRKKPVSQGYCNPWPTVLRSDTNLSIRQH